jgi:cytidyltransferase-like protein
MYDNFEQICAKKNNLSIKERREKCYHKKGVFDILHPGHISFLKKLKKYADFVVIFVQSDELTRKKKGKCRPTNPQRVRARVLNGIKYVDFVFLDKSKSREEYISLLKFLEPDFVAILKGDAAKRKAYKTGNWKVVELSEGKKKFSTTAIINKVIKRCK